MFLLDDFANRFLQTPFETEKTSGRNGAIGTVMRFIPGGGGYCHIWAIWVCAAVKGMVFKQFTLG